ncbi:ABC-three component system middle component 1 [Alkaliphilus serpentinus]|uniref:Uncharacterized protein n=1 Tax=Alkaliphilus serpentinus TaxID=1482731 RepID=A0A833HM55_9FIRM|nr:ABC-three component system middle component 1 [Alkaliphilus serpentinus]KAB3527204.1 hypothetical protein F8153_12845 [Alkaliphilus serpentinus]
MIDIIKRILAENQYENIKEGKFYHFLRNISGHKDDYYLIYDIGCNESIKQLDEIIIKSESIFQDLLGYSEDVEKNTTALYLLKTDRKIVPSNPLWHRICEIEEMIEYMKRNVILYTEAEYIEVNSIQGNITNEIREYLKSNEHFLRFKDNNNIRYEIFSKLFIKIHCMNYSFESNEFINLDKRIKVAINKSNNKNIIENCEQIFDGLDNIEQEKMSIDTFLENYINYLQTCDDYESVDDLVEKNINLRLQKERIGK